MTSNWFNGLGVATLLGRPSVGDDLQLSFIERHQAQVQPRKEAGQNQQQPDETALRHKTHQSPNAPHATHQPGLDAAGAAPLGVRKLDCFSDMAAKLMNKSVRLSLRNPDLGVQKSYSTSPRVREKIGEKVQSRHRRRGYNA